MLVFPDNRARFSVTFSSSIRRYLSLTEDLLMFMLIWCVLYRLLMVTHICLHA